jgi:ABC-type transport system involved in multi-copper enzyme maturation permease subunit
VSSAALLGEASAPPGLAAAALRRLAGISAIAGNTVREAVRSRLLYTLLGFGILLICAGVLLSSLSYVETDRILQDVGFAAMRFFGVAIALFVGVGLIHKEVERRTIYTILSKPLSRAEFLLGKFWGLALTVWMQLGIMAAAFAAVSWASGAPLGRAHAAACLLLGVELVVVVAIATFFSAFTTPMLSSLFAGGLWLVGNLTRDLREIGSGSELPVVRHVTVWLHRLLPDLASFNLSLEAAHGLPITALDVWLPVLYGAAYVAVVLVLAVAIFERRDFR